MVCRQSYAQKTGQWPVFCTLNRNDLITLGRLL